jgi:hypothetical protein
LWKRNNKSINIGRIKMTVLKKLLKIHDSATIKPSFKIEHVLLALIIFEEKGDGIGRYKLQKNLNLREGQVKSLLERMKKLNLIRISSRTKGHIITQDGSEMLRALNKLISTPLKPNFNYKRISIGKYAYYSVVYGGSEKLQRGKHEGNMLEQRDAAIKIGGIGATCLVFLENKFQYPFGSDNVFPELNPDELEEKVSNNDVLVIGTGGSENLARIATLSAALTFIDYLS